MTSITKHFAKLGAPLRNQRWSWGGIRSDGTVVLRVWVDQMDTGRQTVVLHDALYDKHDRSPGRAERKYHLDLIRDGAPYWLVICHAVDPEAVPRSIRSFDERSVFTGSRLIELENGDVLANYDSQREV